EQENIQSAVPVACQEIAGEADESYITAVCRNRGNVRCCVTNNPGRTDADDLRRSGLAIPYENIACSIGVAGDQIAGMASKRDISAVGRKRRVIRGIIAGHATAGKTYALHRVVLAIVDKHIGDTGITRYEVGGRAAERNISTVT